MLASLDDLDWQDPFTTIEALLDRIRKQYPAIPHDLGSLQTSSTLVNCEKNIVEGVDDVHGILYILDMLPVISEICIAVPQSS